MSLSQVFLHSFCYWRSEFCEGIEDGGSGFDLGNLPFEVDGHEAFAQEFDAMHFSLNQGSLMIAAPLLPKCPPQMLDGP